MTQINEQADGIVLGLKEIPALSGVRFVREYSAEPIETPVSGFIAAVGVNSAERKSAFIGGDVSELAGEMLAGLKTADTAGIVSDASVSSIEFDTELNTIFRRIGFRMEFCLCEEGSV